MNLGRKPFITQENGVGSNGLPPGTPIMSRPNLILADPRGNPMTNWREPPGVMQGERMNLCQEPPQRPNLIDPSGSTVNPMGRMNLVEILTRPGLGQAETQLKPMERMMINHNQETLLERQVLPGSNQSQVEPNRQIPQQESMEMADWQELVDIYEQFLQSDEGGEKTGNVNSGEGANRTMAAFQNTPSIEQVKSINPNRNVGANQSRPTLAEVLWKRNLQTIHHSNAAPDKNVFVNDNPLNCSSYSQFEGNYCNNSNDNNNNRYNPMSSYAASDVYNRLYQPRDGFCVPGPTNWNLYSQPSGTVACSSTASFTTLAPVTPDKVQELRSIPPDTVEKSSSPDEKQERVAGCTQEDKDSVRLTLNPLDSSSAEVSPLLKEHSSGNGVNGDVGLNIQTPKLKPQKRRKHRPKVVVEGKPKRTRKASAKKTNAPKENPTGKRKYVRRNDIKPSPLEQSDDANEVSASNGDHAKPCRRVLKFNLENKATNESHEKTELEDKLDEAHKHGDQPFNLNLDAPQSTSTVLASPAQQADAEQQAETCSAPQKPIHPSTPSATSKSHTLNAIARNLNTSNAILYQDNVQNVFNQTTRSQNRASVPMQSALQSISQLVTGDMNDERRSKRDYHQYSSEMYHPQSIEVIRSRLLCHEMSRMGQPDIQCASLEIRSEAHKKRKSENKFDGTLSTSTPSCVTHIKDLSENVQRSSYISHADERLSKTNLHGTRTPKQTEHRLNDILTSWQTSPLASELQFLRQQHASGDRRFSRWKGSVVDSVIGVFLTQNVTDHLSSSAFMSLAARFPAKPSCMEAHGQNNITAWVEEPDIQVMDPDGSIIYRSILTQSRCNQSSLISSDKSECAIENLMTGEIHLANERTKRTDEELFSSQNSSDSCTFQVNEEVRSSSGSNSEAEDQTSEQGQMNFPSHQTIPQNMEFTVLFPKFQHQRMGVPLFETTSPIVGYQQSEHVVYNAQNVTAAKSSSAFDYEIQSDVQCVQNSATAPGDFWSTVKPFLGSGEACFDSPWKETAITHSSATTLEKTTDYSSKRPGQMAGIAQIIAAPTNQPPGLHQNAFLNKSGCHANLQHHSYAQHINQPTSHEETSNVIQTESTVTANSHPAETNAKRQSERQRDPSSKQSTGNDITAENARKRKMADRKPTFDWDSLRKQVQSKNEKKGRSKDAMDSIDYEALRHAEVKQISAAIRERGMNNMLAERIKEFLNRIVREHGSVDLEWLRDVPPDKVKEYLLSIRGLGLKSVECVRLLTLHNLAFPVDTNVGRIAVRLGWVPLQQLPESLQLHLLELYPVLETIQKYLWPRLCKLDQKTLYELHYQMITFGKVFCTKSKPNCNACPMRAECRHFASAFASARLALPGPEEKGMVSSSLPASANGNPAATFKPMPLLPGRSGGTSNVGSTAAIETGTAPVFLNWPMPELPHITSLNREAAGASTSNCEPIIEEPATPEPLPEVSASDIEDAYYDDPDYIPTIELNMKEFTANLQTVLQEQNMGMQEGDLSKALVALNPDAASIPTTKLKNISHLRTEHQVYELPDSHPLLKGMDRREPDDPSPYLLAIWTPGETANSIQLPETKCNTQASGGLCEETTCYSCSSARETNSQTVRGTLLIPCRTATRGSFPLNGTYFQVNEVFADHESSLNPIDVPRQMIWYLPRRTVYFGTSVSTIFKGLSTEQIQHCFWKGFVCVRGFDQKTRAPRPLMARLHFPASRLAKNKNETQKKGVSDAGVTAK